VKRAFITGGSGFLGRHLIPALRERGYEVSGLALAAPDARFIQDAGATPILGSLDDEAALRSGMVGCDLVFHLAARQMPWAPLQEFYRVNVLGTEHVLDAARRAAVPRLLHVSSDSVLIGGRPIVNADETWKRPERSLGLYPLTKSLAEQRVLEANGPSLNTVVVRPQWLWGKGDTTTLPLMAELVRRRRFIWIGGGRYLTGTCHVLNACEGVILAAERGRGGEVYFITDGLPIEYRAFVTALLRTQGLEPDDRSVPHWLALAVAWGSEWAWRTFKLRGSPPLTPAILRMVGEECTVNDAKARRELSYTASVTREMGLTAMAHPNGIVSGNP
jgi:nucleoside-diphosphate-sugar epimerase